MTTRSSKGKTPVKATTTITACDFGYGNTKAIMGETSIIFPSVAGRARDIKFNALEISSKYQGDQITDAYGDWFVGDLALKQIPEAQLLMLKGRTANADEQGMAFRLRMLMAALAKLMPRQSRDEDVVHLQLATGLPVAHMRDAALMKEKLMGTHRVKANNANFIINITECAVMPQPYGTLYAQQILPNGTLDEHYTHLRTAIVDVGRFTVDCALDDNGDFIDSASDSVEAGVHTVQEFLSNALESDFNQKPSYAQVEQVLLTKRFKSGGKAHDYSREVDEAVKPLREATLTLMNRLWANGMGIDAIFVTGGGGPLVIDAVTRAYPQASLVKDSQMSNARGYLSYALNRAMNA